MPTPMFMGKCPCCMFKPVLHVQVPAERTWTFSTDMDFSMDLDMYNSMDTNMQQGNWHAVWTWTCNMDKYMLLVRVHVHAACPCPYCVSQYMLRVHVHSACSCLCCMSTSVLHGLEPAARTQDMQHRHWYTDWIWTCSMDMGTHHGQVCTCCLSKSYPCCMSMSILHTMPMLHVPIRAGCLSPYCMFMTYAACHCQCCSPCRCTFMSMLHVHCPCPCWKSMSMLKVHVRAVCSFPCSRDIDMQHGHGHAAWTWTQCYGSGSVPRVSRIQIRIHKLL